MRRFFTLLTSAAVLITLDWGTGTASPEAGEEAPLTPESAVSLALANHPMLRAARTEVAAAEADKKTARSGYLPRLDLTEDYARSTNPVFVFASRLGQQVFGPADFAVSSLNEPDPFTNAATRLVLRQNISDADRTRLGNRAASLGISAATDGETRAREEVAFGADLVSHEFRRRYAAVGPDEPFVISTPCPAVVSCIEKIYPELVPYLANVCSPMEAMGRVVRRLADGDAAAERPAVVFIGPNNSGKTTALQALALWEVGLRSWLAKRGGKASPEKRPGVAVNRRDLIAVPVPAANLLWRALHTRNVQTIEGKQRTRNIRVDVIVEGVTADRAWQCGFEFDYQNEESFVCRPIRHTGYEDVQVKDAKFSDVPEEANAVRVAYLPPMSGLADREFIKQPGEIGFLVGQGQTAQVLRNMCFQIYSREDKSSWEAVVRHVLDLFGVKLNPPEYIAERSEILMDYEEKGHDEGAVTLDLSSAGRGLQQTLLLLAHLYANPETVLLLDEPDAHLEILRQRQTSIQQRQPRWRSPAPEVLGQRGRRGKGGGGGG